MQDVSARSAGFFPQIYRYGPTNLGFNRRKFILWLVDGTVQVIIPVWGGVAVIRLLMS